MSSTDRSQKSAAAVNSPGWKLVNGRWLWWDGRSYTHQAEADGTTRSTPPPAKSSNRRAMIGLILFGITGFFFWVIGPVSGPVIVVLGVVGRSEAKASGERTTFPTVVITLGVLAFLLGLIAVAMVSSPDFSM